MRTPGWLAVAPMVTAVLMPTIDPGGEQAAIRRAVAAAVPEPRTPPVGDDPVPPAPAEQRDGVPEPWSSLADCESGDWLDGGAAFVEGSARWEWAKPGGEVPPWGTTIHHGGLQFLPATWEWVAGDLGILEDYPHAYDAPPSVQVEVAEEIQDRQGWGAWPVCSTKVGLR